MMSYMEKFSQTSASLDRMGLLYTLAELPSPCPVLNLPAGSAGWDEMEAAGLFSTLIRLKERGRRKKLLLAQAHWAV